MRGLTVAFLLGIITSCTTLTIRNHGVSGTSIIPSASPLPTTTPSPVDSLRVDKKHQAKKLHNFLAAYGWVKKDKEIPDAKMPDAIKRVQKVLKVPQTGVYDEHMDTVMSRPRCGTVPQYNESDGLDADNIQKRFVIWGPKWDHTTITYRFVNYTADLPAAQQRSLIDAAFARWAQFVPLTFVPAPSSATKADIHIRFMTMDPTNDAYAFTNMIADGLSLSSGLINITFNDYYPWNSDDRLFNYTAIHEIGHALGMSHSKVEEAIMFPFYDAKIRPIHPDDQAGIHGIYGWKTPRWTKIDGNTASRDMIQVSSNSDTPTSGDGVYQLRSTGQILLYNSTSSIGTSTTWSAVDNNKDTVQIAGANGILYQRHSDGSTYKYPGASTPWQRIGLASDNVLNIVSAADQVYARRKDGWIVRWAGGTSTSWTTIQQPSAPSSLQIAVTDSKTLWNLLANGDLVRSEWPYTSSGWQIVDQNDANVAIAVGGEEFYKLQSDGIVVWLDMEAVYWVVIEDAGSIGVFAVGQYVYSRHEDGSIWRYTGTPGVWEMLDGRNDSVSVIGDRKGGVYEMVQSGDIYKIVS